MTEFLLTVEAAVVFGASTWVLLRIWTRSRMVSLADVDFYDHPGGLRLPRSMTAGPRAQQAQLASGFERSPLGALLAAINIAYRTAGTLGEHVWRPTIGRQVVGEEREALLAAAGNTARTGHGDVPGFGRRVAWYDVELIGWEVESYSPRWAAIRYLLTRPQETGPPLQTTMRVEVSWVDDDWKVIAPPEGDWARAFSRDDDRSTFRPFPLVPPGRSGG